MHPFDIAAVLIAVAAVAGYVNRRILKLPSASGTLVVALISSLAVVAAEAVFPRLDLLATVARFLGQIDFNQTLMRGMLCFLLFAGALRVDLQGLREHKWGSRFAVCWFTTALVSNPRVPRHNRA